jgi:hypothetical protein
VGVDGIVGLGLRLEKTPLPPPQGIQAEVDLPAGTAADQNLCLLRHLIVAVCCRFCCRLLPSQLGHKWGTTRPQLGRSLFLSCKEVSKNMPETRHLARFS